MVLLSGALLLTGCGKDNENGEIRRPLSEHLTGKWMCTSSTQLMDGKWVEDPTEGEHQQLYYFHPDGKGLQIRTSPDGMSAIRAEKWATDEDSCTWRSEYDAPEWWTGAPPTAYIYPIWKLTADEFGFGYHTATDKNTHEPVNGDFRWTYRRLPDDYQHPAEGYLGKWLFSQSYKKEQGKWVESSFGIPDEGWHEYRKQGDVKFHSRMGDQVSEGVAMWSVNCTTGEMVWQLLPDGKNQSTQHVTVEGDTMTILYSQSFDPATGQVLEGEFKDILIRSDKK